MATYGMGGGLANYGMGQQQEATQLLGESAKEEAQREMENKRLKQQAKAGNAQLGATTGAMSATGSMSRGQGAPLRALTSTMAMGTRTSDHRQRQASAPSTESALPAKRRAATHSITLSQNARSGCSSFRRLRWL
jgi:hypothetical protein